MSSASWGHRAPRAVSPVVAMVVMVVVAIVVAALVLTFVTGMLALPEPARPMPVLRVQGVGVGGGYLRLYVSNLGEGSAHVDMVLVDVAGVVYEHEVDELVEASRSGVVSIPLPYYTLEEATVVLPELKIKVLSREGAEAYTTITPQLSPPSMSLLNSMVKAKGEEFRVYGLIVLVVGSVSDDAVFRLSSGEMISLRKGLTIIMLVDVSTRLTGKHIMLTLNTTGEVNVRNLPVKLLMVLGEERASYRDVVVERAGGFTYSSVASTLTLRIRAVEGSEVRARIGGEDVELRVGDELVLTGLCPSASTPLALKILKEGAPDMDMVRSGVLEYHVAGG